MACIVLDTDVVSMLPASRLPGGFTRQVATNDIRIVFATASELSKGALTRQWGGACRGGLELWLDETMILPAGLRVAKVWGRLRP